MERRTDDATAARLVGGLGETGLSRPAAPGGARPRPQSRPAAARALAAVLALTVALTVVEAVGGVWTGSLALLADAGHMLADDVSLALALLALWIARRPPTPERSFGYRRAEILAALVNGIALVAIAIWIFVEAVRRLADPPEVLGGWMLAIAAVGLAGNAIAAFVLARTGTSNLNVRAALRHVLADLLGSAGAIAAAIVVLATGWLQADAIVGMLIALLILAGSWSILRDSVSILLEATPREVDARAVGTALSAAPGVVEVHDLHIWTITSGFPALSAHVLVARGEDCHVRRSELEQLLVERFGIAHTTLQVEHAADRDELLEIRPLGRRPG